MSDKLYMGRSGGSLQSCPPISALVVTLNMPDMDPPRMCAFEPQLANAAQHARNGTMESGVRTCPPER